MPQPQTFDRIAHLKLIPDYRKAKGRRHEQCLVLMLVLLHPLGRSRLSAFSGLLGTTLAQPVRAVRLAD